MSSILTKRFRDGGSRMKSDDVYHLGVDSEMRSVPGVNGLSASKCWNKGGTAI